MDKPKWGCPECGSTEVRQHVKLSATREGKFRPSGDGWEFDPDDEYDRDSVDVDDEGEFECESCGGEFERPARVREGGIRLVVRVGGDMFKPNERGVEEEMDDTFSAGFDVECADPEQGKRLFETLRLFLKGVAESAGAGR